MLSKDAIEKYATNAVEDVLNMSPYLSTYIADNDKEPSWDGNVYIYKTVEKRKDRMHGRIPVQVKGHECKELPDQESTFQIEIAHLENYLEDGGAILFVVYVKEQNPPHARPETKVFYSALTPIKLRSILARKKKADQETISVTVDVFPENPDESATICLNCMKDCHKQASFSGKQLPSMEEIEKSDNIECITTSVSGFGIDKDYIKAFLTNETYLYAKVKGSDAPVPILGIPIEKVISVELQEPVTVNGKQYYSSCRRVRKVDSATLVIGGFFTISHSFEEQKIHYSFKQPNHLRKRVEALAFVIDAIEAGHFEIGKASFPYPCEEDEREKLIDSFSCEHQSCLRAVMALDKLHCKDDVDLTTLSKDDMWRLRSLTDAMLDNEPIRNVKEEQPYIARLNIGTLCFLMCFEELKDEKNSYRMTDFFDTELFTAAKPTEDSERLPVPKYIVLHKDEFLHLSNIQYEQILPAFKKFDRNPYLLQIANGMMLEAISAYDEATQDRKEALYHLADEFASWLLSLPDEWDTQIALLNKFQIIKRVRALNKDEEKILFNIEESHPERDDILVGTYLLLDDSKHAHRYFEKMDAKAQEEFRQYPIYKFWIE